MKSVIYVNPSGIGEKHNQVLEGLNDGVKRDAEEERRKGATAEKERKLVQRRRWRRPFKGKKDIERMIERWQAQAETGRQTEATDRQGHVYTPAEKPLLVVVTHHVWHRSDIFKSGGMQRAAWHFYSLDPWTTRQGYNLTSRHELFSPQKYCFRQIYLLLGESPP